VNADIKLMLLALLVFPSSDMLSSGDCSIAVFDTDGMYREWLRHFAYRAYSSTLKMEAVYSSKQSKCLHRPEDESLDVTLTASDLTLESAQPAPSVARFACAYLDVPHIAFCLQQLQELMRKCCCWC
jgi:hypothetical protein